MHTLHTENYPLTTRYEADRYVVAAVHAWRLSRLLRTLGGQEEALLWSDMALSRARYAASVRERQRGWRMMAGEDTNAPTEEHL